MRPVRRWRQGVATAGRGQRDGAGGRLAGVALALALAVGCRAGVPATRPSAGPLAPLAAAPGAPPWRPVPPAALPDFREVPFDAVLPPALADAVVLTFDDGPDAAGQTDRVLDILRARGVPATFFLNADTATTGGPIVATPARGQTVRRMLAEGHLIGNHTVHHHELRELDAPTLAAELDGVEAAVRQVTGNPSLRLTLLRAPYGRPFYAASRAKDPPTFLRVAAAMAPRGVHVAWSIDPHDWDDKPPAAVRDDILAAIDAGRRGIILMHSVQARTVAILPELIDAIRARGLRFATTEDVVCALYGPPPLPLPPPSRPPVPLPPR